MIFASVSSSILVVFITSSYHPIPYIHYGAEPPYFLATNIVPSTHTCYLPQSPHLGCVQCQPDLVTAAYVNIGRTMLYKFLIWTLFLRNVPCHILPFKYEETFAANTNSSKILYLIWIASRTRLRHDGYIVRIFQTWNQCAENTVMLKNVYVISQCQCVNNRRQFIQRWHIFTAT